MRSIDKPPSVPGAHHHLAAPLSGGTPLTQRCTKRALVAAIPTRDAGEVSLAGEIADLLDCELIEQALTLASLPPALARPVLSRLQLTLAELARRMEARP